MKDDGIVKYCDYMANTRYLHFGRLVHSHIETKSEDCINSAPSSQDVVTVFILHDPVEPLPVLSTHLVQSQTASSNT